MRTQQIKEHSISFESIGNGNVDLSSYMPYRLHFSNHKI